MRACPYCGKGFSGNGFVFESEFGMASRFCSERCFDEWADNCDIRGGKK